MKTAIAMACMVAWIGVHGLPAHSQTTPAEQAHKARKVKPPRAPANTGNAETRKEREQRLLRECRGKPNAGACEGYTQ